MTHSRRAALGRLGLLAGIPLLGAAAAPAEPASAADAAGRVDVTAYGAVGDDSTDSSAAIARAVDAVTGRSVHGGVVWFPAGFYVASAPIVLPKNVVLAGESPIAARLRYSGPATEAFVTVGRPGQVATFSGIRGLWVNASARARTTVLLHGPQEGSLISETIAEGATAQVIEVRSAGIEGGSNKFVIERCWLWTTGDAATAGVRIGPGGGPVVIRDTTVAGTNRSKGAPSGSGGVVAAQSIVLLDDVNVEHFESHTHLDRTQATIRGATGFFNRYGVVTTAASTATTLDIENSDFDRTQRCVVDRGSGVTIRFCRSYSNEAYRYDRRHFRRNHWDLGSTNVYQSERRQTTMGFTDPGSGGTHDFAFTTLVGKRWRRSAQIDARGVFGTAGSGWDDAHLRMGAYRLWIDAKGRLRIKRGVPAHDRDGRVVGR